MLYKEGEEKEKVIIPDPNLFAGQLGPKLFSTQNASGTLHLASRSPLKV